MLAYYVEWHMKEAWRKLLFSDEEIYLKASRDPVKPAKPSESAKNKAKTKYLENGNPAHSFHTLMANLSTIVLNVCRMKNIAQDRTFTTETKLNKTQKTALQLLESIVHPVQ